MVRTVWFWLRLHIQRSRNVSFFSVWLKLKRSHLTLTYVNWEITSCFEYVCPTPTPTATLYVYVCGDNVTSAHVFEFSRPRELAIQIAMRWSGHRYVVARGRVCTSARGGGCVRRREGERVYVGTRGRVCTSARGGGCVRRHEGEGVYVGARGRVCTSARGGGCVRRLRWLPMIVMQVFIFQLTLVLTDLFSAGYFWLMLLLIF